MRHTRSIGLVALFLAAVTLPACTCGSNIENMQPENGGLDPMTGTSAATGSSSGTPASTATGSGTDTAVPLGTATTGGLTTIDASTTSTNPAVTTVAGLAGTKNGPNDPRGAKLKGLDGGAATNATPPDSTATKPTPAGSSATGTVPTVQPTATGHVPKGTGPTR